MRIVGGYVEVSASGIFGTIVGTPDARFLQNGPYKAFASNKLRDGAIKSHMGAMNLIGH